MRDLRPPFDYIAEDLVATLKKAYEHHRKDYEHYPVCMAVEHILQKYELKLRSQPLTREDIMEPELPCIVCGRPLGPHVREAAVKVGKGKPMFHPECVVNRKP